MKVLRTIRQVRTKLGAARARGERIALVPTMGALHEGHLSLVRSARRNADVSVVSIFVNPLQFGPGDDLERYPRDEERDLSLAEREGTDIVFAPSVGEMYPRGASTMVAAGELGAVLEGAARPGHFDGVCTVVAKLFNIVEPDVAVFGQKDAQQVAVVQAMVRDLAYRTSIVVGPTVREHDGLALSSRNAYLDEDQRRRAVALYRALSAGADVLRAGALPEDARRRMHEVAAQPGVDLEYAEVVDPGSFDSPRDVGPALLVIAGRVGGTRLIDNLLVEAHTGADGRASSAQPARRRG